MQIDIIHPFAFNELWKNLTGLYFQILNLKMNKENKNYTENMDYMIEDTNRSFEEHYDNIEGNLDKFDDYIDDEFEEK